MNGATQDQERTEDVMAGWEALLDLTDRTSGTRTAALTAALRQAIADGRLGVGVRLPSTRDLAGDLGLSRGVVVSAYEQLVAEGRLTTRRGAGTVVAAAAADAAGQRHTREVVSERRPFPLAPLRPGVPDLAMFPRVTWRRAYDKALTGALNADLDYGDPTGAARLRLELAGYLGRVRAARADANSVIVTTGAAQAMTLLAVVLRRRGLDAIAVEDPSSEAMRSHFAAHGVRCVPVPVDRDGIDVDALAASRHTAVFLTPAHQFPTGVVLAPGRRAALIAWARARGAMVIEDDYDAEFRYDREPIGCLQGVAPDVVTLIGSVSKALAPALRLGWLVPPVGWQKELAAAKEAADLGGPVVEQLAFAHLVAAGDYDRHLRHVRREQRARRDAVVDAVRRHLPEGSVSGVAAGLHLVVELPQHLDDRGLVRRARAAGLFPHALSTLRQLPGGPPGLVLGYATHRPDQLTDAVRRLAELAHEGDASAARR